MEILRQQLNSIVGREYVLDDPATLNAYSGSNMSFVPERAPLLAVKPGTVEEVQAVLRVASLNRFPVIPWSSPGRGHGASIPSVPGVTLDLTRLNRIHLIDEVYRNAILEPGVSFAQLQESVKKKGLRVLCALDLPASASVVSTYLEMSPLYAWPRYGTEAVLTMEVLIPSGELIKTGMAAIPVIDKPYFPFGTTPAYFNKVWFGAQGTLGIATKASIKLKTDYVAKKVLFMPVDTFEQILPALKEIKRLDSPVEFFVADAVYLAGLLADNPKTFSIRKADLPPATAVMVLRGEEEQVAYQMDDLEDLVRDIGLTLTDHLRADNNAAHKLLDEIEQPGGHERFKNLRGSYAVIPFICMAHQIPLFNRVVSQIAQQFQYDPRDIGSMLLPVEPSRVHFQYSFYAGQAGTPDYERVKQVFHAVSSTLIKMGAFFSRPYGEWAAKVYEKADAYKTMLKRIKKEIDPDTIMNPGKLNL